MNRSQEKILKALEENSHLTQQELMDITGYKGIRQVISDLNNLYEYDIRPVRINGITHYKLFNGDDEPEEEEEQETLEEIKYVPTTRSIKSAKESISKYYDMINEVSKEVKKVINTPIKLTTGGESLVVINSDWHIGKKIMDDNGNEIYNTKIACENLDKFYNNLRKLTKHICNSTTIDEIVICNVGDLIDGETIYTGQILNIDEYMSKQIEIATRQKIKQVEILQNDFGVPIREEYVVGNHGRSHASFGGVTNFEALVHLNEQIVRDMTKNKDLHICEGHMNKNRLIDIRGHKVLMRHHAPAQTETPSAFKQYGGWLNNYNYDALFTAHYHSAKISYFQGRPIIRNGCIFGDDDYSIELGYKSNPCQIVLGVSDERFPTYTYTLDMKE